jgi:hypothetical protein
MESTNPMLQIDEKIENSKHQAHPPSMPILQVTIIQPIKTNYIYYLLV